MLPQGSILMRLRSYTRGVFWTRFAPIACCELSSFEARCYDWGDVIDFKGIPQTFWPARSYQDTRVYGTPSRLDQRQSPLRLANRRRVGWRQPRLDQPLLIRDRQPHWIAEHSTISSSILAMVISSNSHATLTGRLTKLASLVELGRRPFPNRLRIEKGY